MRDKLIEILEQAGTMRQFPGTLANILIEKGVTVQMWIPVSERLPDRNGEYLVCTKNDFYKTRKMAKAIFKKNSSGFYGQGGHWANVTHWMQLPEFPKEV